ncbi:MAG: SMP-30/gluconolactonase/LRE family protein [Candidatus Latescibacteria bacterium]|nr:SMP-30/gluconolactonase/LRE family protein [Candidatus Latescibacterota bacterium]
MTKGTAFDAKTAAAILKTVIMLLTAAFFPGVSVLAGDLYVSTVLTDACFTSGIEGPACDGDGMLYAVNYRSQGAIGMVTPGGDCSLFVDLPAGSVGNGIRFDSRGDMFIADYTAHNVLRVDMETREVSVFAHESAMSQPNDLAITGSDILFASDPDWKNGTGRIWRIDNDGAVTLLSENPGTTNGIEVCPGDSILYVVERSSHSGGTADNKILAYDLGAEGDISNMRTLVRLADGHIDGMRCDVDGNIYAARPSTGKVTKVSPAGEVLLEVVLHGNGCTNIAFGGADGCTCYVTVAGTGRIETFRAERPGRSWRLFRERKPLAVLSPAGEEPEPISLSQPYPNPFNPETTIEFSLARPEEVELAVFNTVGQKVSILARGFFHPGAHCLTWNAAGMPAGVYFCRMRSGSVSLVKKMMLLR